MSTQENTLAVDREYEGMVSCLKDTYKMIKVGKCAVNYNDLVLIVSRKPKILHFSCHGDYSREKNSYFLQFEN